MSVAGIPHTLNPTVPPTSVGAGVVQLMASNASGYQEDHTHDHTTTTGLTEKQRIVLACVTALLLAVCAIVIGFVLRRLMKKSGVGGVYTVEANFPLWRRRSDTASDDVTACAISHQRPPPVTSDVTSKADDVRHDMEGAGPEAEPWRGGGAASTTANGSHCVITMTMRNNHLIVETEEPSSDVTTTPPLTLVSTADPPPTSTTTTTTAVCDVTTAVNDVTSQQHQPEVHHHCHEESGAQPQGAPGSRTGLTQADDVDSEWSYGSPRHPYTYGGGQSEYGCNERLSATRQATPATTTQATGSHQQSQMAPRHYFQTQASQDIVAESGSDTATARQATATTCANEH